MTPDLTPCKAPTPAEIRRMIARCVEAGRERAREKRVTKGRTHE